MDASFDQHDSSEEAETSEMVKSPRERPRNVVLSGDILHSHWRMYYIPPALPRLGIRTHSFKTQR